uniref:Uncharacterized protein LOC108949706 n=1 Tax=Phallusia mammillata TaxID=59560 RepID=A0A6F9DJQ4_9ASCI|nr:uncharacterized protein LOC108949706 [Phallusia mammillata]
MVLEPSALTILYYTYGAVAGAVFVVSFVVTSAVFWDTRVIKYARRKARREVRREDNDRGRTNPDFQPELQEQNETQPTAPEPRLINTSLQRQGTLPPPYEAEYLAPNAPQVPAASPVNTTVRRQPRAQHPPLPDIPIYQALGASELDDQQVPQVVDPYRNETIAQQVVPQPQPRRASEYDNTIPPSTFSKKHKESLSMLPPSPASPLQPESDVHETAETSFAKRPPIPSAFVYNSKASYDHGDHLPKEKLQKRPSVSKKPIQETAQEQEMPDERESPKWDEGMQKPMESLGEQEKENTENATLPLLESIATPIVCVAEANSLSDRENAENNIATTSEKPSVYDELEIDTPAQIKDKAMESSYNLEDLNPEDFEVGVYASVNKQESESITPVNVVEDEDQEDVNKDDSPSELDNDKVAKELEKVQYPLEDAVYATVNKQPSFKSKHQNASDDESQGPNEDIHEVNPKEENNQVIAVADVYEKNKEDSESSTDSESEETEDNSDLAKEFVLPPKELAEEKSPAESNDEGQNSDSLTDEPHVGLEKLNMDILGDFESMLQGAVKDKQKDPSDDKSINDKDSLPAAWDSKEEFPVENEPQLDSNVNTEVETGIEETNKAALM